MIFLTLLWSVYLLCKPNYCKTRRQYYRPPWKSVKKFCRHHLNYSLVQSFHRCHGKRPFRLNGYYFPSPQCNNRCCWRRRKNMERDRHKRHQTVQELFLTSSIKPLFHVHIKKEVPDATLASFCNGSQYFL